MNCFEKLGNINFYLFFKQFQDNIIKHLNSFEIPPSTFSSKSVVRKNKTYVVIGELGKKYTYPTILKWPCILRIPV
jgi:hypothetical protein